MAQKFEASLEDDLDAGPAKDTVAFALGGQNVKLDLSAANAK